MNAERKSAVRILEVPLIPDEDDEEYTPPPSPVTGFTSIKSYDVEVGKGAYKIEYRVHAVDMDCAINVARRMYTVDYGYLGNVEKFVVWEVG